MALQSSILHWKDDPSYALSPLLRRCTELTLLGPTFPYNFDNAADIFNTSLPFGTILRAKIHWRENWATAKVDTPCQPRGYAKEDFKEIKQVLESKSLEMIVLHMKPKNCSGTSDIQRSIDEWRVAAWEYDPRLYVVEAGKTSLSHTEWEGVVRGAGFLWGKG